MLTFSYFLQKSHPPLCKEIFLLNFYHFSIIGWIERSQCCKPLIHMMLSKWNHSNFSLHGTQIFFSVCIAMSLCMLYYLQSHTNMVKFRCCSCPKTAYKRCVHSPCKSDTTSMLEKPQSTVPTDLSFYLFPQETHTCLWKTACRASLPSHATTQAEVSFGPSRTASERMVKTPGNTK